MSYALLAIWSALLAAYSYRVGFKNGQFDGMSQMSEIWPIDLGHSDSNANFRGG